LSQPPNPKKAKKRLLKAIENNEPADKLLCQILTDAAVTVGPVTIHIWSYFNDNLKEYSDLWLTLTSPQGREWVKKNIDKIFKYIEYLVRYEAPET